MPADDVTLRIGTEGADQAVQDLAKVNKAADELNKKKVSPAVQVKGAFDQLKTVTAATVKMTTAAGALQREFGKALDPAAAAELAKTLSGLGIELDTIIDHTELVGHAMEQLSQQSGLSIDQLIGPAGESIRELGAGAERAHSAIAGMLGDTTGELLQMGGAGNEAATGIASLAEQFAELALQGGASKDLFAGLIKAAGPIAAVAVGVGLVTSAFEGFKEKQEEIKRSTETAAAAVEDMSGVTAALQRQFEELGEGPKSTFADKLPVALLQANEAFGETVVKAREMGIEFGTLGKILTGLGEKGTAQGLATLTDEVARTLGLSAENADKVAVALANSKGNMEVFLTQLSQMDTELGLSIAQLPDAQQEVIAGFLGIAKAAEETDIEDVAKAQLTQLMLLKDGIQLVGTAIGELQKQGIINPTAQQILVQVGDRINQVAKATTDWIRANKSLDDMAQAWHRVGVAAEESVKSGEDHVTFLREMRVLMDAYGLTEEQVINKSIDLLGDERQARLDSLEAARQAHDQFIADKKAESVAILDVEQSLGELGSAFGQLKLGADAVSSAFDISNAPLEFLGRLTDIHDAMRDVALFLDEPAEKVDKLNEKIADLNKKKLRVDVKGKNAAEQISDINDEMADLVDQRAKLQKHIKVPNIFDPNDVDAGPFLAKIKALRQPIQEEIGNVFATQGPQAAIETANRFVDELFQTLGGRISKEDIASLLALKDIEVTLKVAVDEKSKAVAQKELEAFVRLQGETPFTATLALALESGKLSPGALQNILRGEFAKIKGFDIAVLPKTSDADSANAVAEAQTFMKDPKHSVEMVSVVGTPTNVDAKHREVTDTLKQDPVQWPVDLDLAPNAFDDLKRQIQVEAARSHFRQVIENFFKFFDAGGTVGGTGGIVAERRPEIVDGRFLVTQPTVVPPGTRVTSGARTARILRHGTRRLRRYDAGGMVRGGPTTNVTNISVSAAVIGNRFDVMRAVRRAEMDRQRLLGTRG